MSDKLVNLRDIRFVLYEVLKVEGLLDSERYSMHSRETFDMAIDAAYKLAREVFWPAYTAMDKNGVTYDPGTRKTEVSESMHKVWAASKEGGWFGITSSSRAPWGARSSSSSTPRTPPRACTWEEPTGQRT
jgi:hypothetical protein